MQGVRCSARRVAVFALALSSLGIAACSRDPAPPADAATSSQRVPGPVAALEPSTSREGPAPAGATIGGDGSPIALQALAPDDVAAANLGGELGCVFVDRDGAPLLHAMGVVASDDPALGIVRIAGVVETVRAPGGYDGMLADPVWSAPGMTIRISVTGVAQGGGESPPRPATLTVLRADGATRGIDGQWQCGP